jgi:hypothetical protein
MGAKWWAELQNLWDLTRAHYRASLLVYTKNPSAVWFSSAMQGFYYVAQFAFWLGIRSQPAGQALASDQQMISFLVTLSLVDNTYLFLGDYVDRGYYSCEVMLYLLSLKIMYPDKIWLLRGNHECASVSGHFGFKEECKTKYGVNIYYSFLLLFQTMPLAAGGPIITFFPNYLL